jgi:CheY-like chemotaxis protein
MTLKLIQAQEEAVAGTEAKSNFLANMSHEMRTPLNAIIGFSELELGKENDEEKEKTEKQENLEKIYTSGVTLLGIINDILDISKISSGHYELIPVVYDIPSLINDTIVLNIIRIGSKPISFVLDVDENIPSRLLGDELKIKQILNNLLSNAFKYTKEGSVTLKIRCKPETTQPLNSLNPDDPVILELNVTDTGIGIHPDDLNKIFSDYTQVDVQKNRHIEGTGLGLAITKQLIELMGGSIKVESDYGKGSTFNVWIKQGYVNDVIIGSVVAENLKNFKYSMSRQVRNKNLARAWIPYANVLVVDDVSTNLDVARGMLKPYGMVVDCVKSGQEAIDLIKSQNIIYNAIFMDHMMPEMDGIERCASSETKLTPNMQKTYQLSHLPQTHSWATTKYSSATVFKIFSPSP